MKIIKHGKYFVHQIQMSCQTCGCVFSPEHGECEIFYGVTRVRYEAHCPECSKLVVRDVEVKANEVD